jgi:hypothetical protein
LLRHQRRPGYLALAGLPSICAKAAAGLSTIPARPVLEVRGVGATAVFDLAPEGKEWDDAYDYASGDAQLLEPLRDSRAADGVAIAGYIGIRG